MAKFSARSALSRPTGRQETSFGAAAARQNPSEASLLPVGKGVWRNAGAVWTTETSSVAAVQRDGRVPAMGTVAFAGTQSPCPKDRVGLSDPSLLSRSFSAYLESAPANFYDILTRLPAIVLPSKNCFGNRAAHSAALPLEPVRCRQGLLHHRCEFQKEGFHGRFLYCADRAVLCRRHWAGIRMRKAPEAVMNWLYLLAGLLALAVFVYLVVALFFPEKF